MPLNLSFPIRTGLVVLAVSGLAACSFAPEYVRPEAPVAAQWPVVPSEAQASGSSSQTQADIAAWQDFIVDEQLRQLVALALQNNRDLRLALANMEQARAQYQIRSADQLPTINAGVTGNRQPKTDGSGDMTSTYSAGLLLTAWELDVFGRIASLKTVAQAQWLATQEARNAVQTSLVAAVASTWLSWQSNGQLLALTQATLASREESLRLVRLRFEQGVASALELRQAESVLAAARVAQAQQQRLQALDVNALTLLVGQALPESMQQYRPVVETVAATALPLREVPVGLPSDLLQHRPDIRQAEQQLLAAHANIGAARAAFFPRITLTASAGTASGALSGLFESGSWGWTLAPQALLPIFDAGRNQANLELAQAGRQLALVQYEKAIQTAFREVADALAGQTTLQQQWQAQQAQMQAEQERLRLADLRYRNGVASHLELLDAQRALFASQQAWVQTRLAQQQNQIALYKALGGGWKEGSGL